MTKGWSAAYRIGWCYCLLPLIYAFLGHYSLMLAVPPGYATGMFIPAGIAVASAFVIGNEALLGVFVGSFALNVWQGYVLSQYPHYEVATVIAFASALQAIVGAHVFRWCIEIPMYLRGLVLLLILSPIICVISATTALVIMRYGLGMSFNFFHNWLSWWSGDSFGVVFIMSFLLIYFWR